MGKKDGKIKVVNVVGARPNFMKIAPLTREMERRSSAFEPFLLHTGQHYDANLSKVFFDELRLPKPDAYLGVGSGTHAEQTARIMTGFERVLCKQRPDLVIVVGDVNSTLACALVAAKQRVPVAHVEAGLRSYDWRMPEEINRVIADRLSALLFTTSLDCERNLAREGITEGIFFVGNTMIDSLLAFRKIADATREYDKLGLEKKSFGLVTMHRPENVDDPRNLRKIARLLAIAAKHARLVFPMHPRTRKTLRAAGLFEKVRKTALVTPPLGYAEFLNLEANAKFVLTDSGGVQEETTVLRTPCLTLRRNTERPVTVTQGTNTVVNLNEALLAKTLEHISAGSYKKGGVPEKWDGGASRRICSVLEKKF
jgi:UDP-N-acetylglucosamine 2-epimerase (non-hydrolysing)